jgi:hypothetical protein
MVVVWCSVGASSAAPHDEQKFAAIGLVCPQRLQTTSATT